MKGHILLSTSTMQGTLEAIFKKGRAQKRLALEFFPLLGGLGSFLELELLDRWALRLCGPGMFPDPL